MDDNPILKIKVSDNIPENAVLLAFPAGQEHKNILIKNIGNDTTPESQSIQSIIRQKLANLKRDTGRRLAAIHSQPSDIEAEMRCMWKMILGKEVDYGKRNHRQCRCV